MTKETIRPAKLVDSEIFLWYACTTKPRAEKVAARELDGAGVEYYLPLLKTRRKWSDRIKWVELPLFRSYIFVRVNRDNYIKVTSQYSVSRFVTFEGRAVPIPEEQIETIRLLLNEGAELEVTSDKISPGEKIIVQAGPLLGLQGELIEYRGKRKVLVQIGELAEGLLVTIPLELLARDQKTI